MRYLTPLSPFEIIMLFLSTFGGGIASLLYISGTTFFSEPDFSQTVAPAAFDAQYISINSEPVPQSSATPTETSEQDTHTQTDSSTLSATAPVPAPTIRGPQLPKVSERIFLLYPRSQALLTHTRAEGKGYPLKLKFEVDPVNTPCRLELKMGDETVLVKELDGSATGMFEVSVLIKKPALYKWQVFTQHSHSEERLFTIRK